MRVIETTAHVGNDGLLRLEVPLDERNQDVRVTVVVESPLPSAKEADSIADPWAPYRAKLEASGVQVPPPGAWHPRHGDPLRFDGPSVSETLVKDRR